MDLGHYQEAETHFKESLLVLRSDPKNVESWRIKTVINGYVELLQRTGRVQEITEFKKQSDLHGLYNVLLNF